MFNLIKFEISKRKKTLTTLGITFLIAQLFLIYKLRTSPVDLQLPIMFGASIVCYIVFLFSSLSTFSKDINSTDQSIVFMIPKSGFTIIGAKFIATLILGMILFFISCLLILANLYYRDPLNTLNLLKSVSSVNNLLGAVILGFTSFGSFLALVSLSIITTKSFLSKLKFKNLITIIVMFIISKLFTLVFWNNFTLESSLNTGISFLGTIFVTTIMLWIAGWLVDNKTDF